jgi:hypothetical protein
MNIKKEEKRMRIFQDLLTETRIPLSLGKFFLLSIFLHVVMGFVMINLDLDPPELPKRNMAKKTRPKSSPVSPIREEERFSGFRGTAGGGGSDYGSYSSISGANERAVTTEQEPDPEVIYKIPSSDLDLDVTGNKHLNLYDKPFRDVRKQPGSNFPLTRRKTETFNRVKEYIEKEEVPPQQLIKIEEMINYFNYDYPLPQGDELFTVTTELAECPWEPGHFLLNIGLQAKIVEADQQLRQRDFVIAKNLKMNVAFKDNFISAYRLLGHGNREPVPGESVENDMDSSHLRMGQTMTTLYQLIPDKESIDSYLENKDNQDKEPQIATIHIRYYDPEKDDKELLEETYPVRHPLDCDGLDSASEDFIFSAVVAQFAMILKNPGIENFTRMAQLINTARDAVGEDRFGYRKEFIKLLEKYNNIKNEER